jgi:hypothetical protein
MLHLLHYPHELIAERVVFTPADQAQIATCRGPHNRLVISFALYAARGKLFRRLLIFGPFWSEP